MERVTVAFERSEELKGLELGPSAWRSVTQEQVDLFARATGDQQWIHTEPERAARESPFGGTVAHGYLTLALVPVFFWELLEVKGVRLVVNYGANKVRFPAPVPVPSRVRMAARILEVRALDKGFDLVLEAKVEVENQARPAMVAEVLFRYAR